MLIVGIASDGLLYPIAVDSSGNLKIDIDELTTNGEKIKLDSSGRIVISTDQPSALRPTSQSVGVTNLALPAGASTQTIATVPANELWRMTFATHRYVGTVAGVTMVSDVVIGGNVYPFLYTPVVTNGFIYTQLLNVLLPAGASVQTRITGATLNDDYQGVIYAERIE